MKVGGMDAIAKFYGSHVRLPSGKLGMYWRELVVSVESHNVVDYPASSLIQ
ncbi:hypothetical protein ACUIJQ_05885 [Levilactobacillus hammesii]|uniref:Uncharacterized protein n=1 Tax=Levilactobacillus hammesii DSM 16381 TaxID=1423753 RepID=A0A0R1UX30_9LACO|nr:hypothetical protein [Levilactobacillus hammesii]KRL95923.1 hypothetical protein FD28_GL002152 [Levilactobacillus hammesii DSM 16381]